MQDAEVLPPPIKPLVHNWFRTADRSVVFSAACFEGNNWSLKPLQESGDEKKHPELAARLNNALYGIGATTALAPYPAEANGKVVHPPELYKHIKLGPVYLYRNKERPADATFLPYYKWAGIFSAGGCGVVVISYKNQLMFGHAGRESLLDRTRVKTEGREHGRSKDLIDNMLDALKIKAGEEHLVYAWPLYFIKPEHFAHRFDDPDPDHAVYNRAAAQYLPKEFAEFGSVDTKGINIDLSLIAKSQLLRRGVPEENVFLSHSYLDDALPTTRRGGGRYLVAVVRHQ